MCINDEDYIPIITDLTDASNNITYMIFILAVLEIISWVTCTLSFVGLVIKCTCLRKNKRREHKEILRKKENNEKYY